MEIDDVRALYEKYPYPSPLPGGDLITDVASGVGLLFHNNNMREWDVLDAGCGTGHRLVALARTFPKARFLGLDVSAHSIVIAKSLADHHVVSNVEFVQGAIPDIQLERSFDLVIATGVLHHLSDVRSGLRWLVDCLDRDGMLYLWSYHSFGEHHRLLDRELVSVLTSGAMGPDAMNVVQALGLKLEASRYGSGASPRKTVEPISQVSLNADAFANPVVHSWRFHELVEAFRDLPIDWVAVNSIDTEGASRLLDLGSVSTDPHFVLDVSDVVPSRGTVSDMYLRLSLLNRLKVIELRVRPTGFTVVCGRGDALASCTSRVAGNVVVGGSSSPSARSDQRELDRRRRRMVRVSLRDNLLAERDRLVVQYGTQEMGRVVSGIEPAAGLRPVKFAHLLQRPSLFFLPGLPANPWFDPAMSKATRVLQTVLEENWRAIRDELDRLLLTDTVNLVPYLQDSYMRRKFGGTMPHEWESVPLYSDGAVQPLVAKSCSVLSMVIDVLSEQVSGAVMLSRLLAGAHLTPHYDDNNYKLTVHLGLHVPKGAAIRVGGETRALREGRCLFFSDAFLHEAWNESAVPRDCLLLDVWHPSLSKNEVKALRAVRRILEPASDPGIFDVF